jgi:hypothetical protein
MSFDGLTAPTLIHLPVAISRPPAPSIESKHFSHKNLHTFLTIMFIKHNFFLTVIMIMRPGVPSGEGLLGRGKVYGRCRPWCFAHNRGGTR